MALLCRNRRNGKVGVVPGSLTDQGGGLCPNTPGIPRTLAHEEYIGWGVEYHEPFATRSYLKLGQCQVDLRIQERLRQFALPQAKKTPCRKHDPSDLMG